MRRSPPRITVDDIPQPVLPAPNALKFQSSAPAVVVQCWCGLVEGMERANFDRFTDIWRRFDERDPSPLRDALRGRRVLARQARP